MFAKPAIPAARRAGYPDGKQTYFRLRDLARAVPDELFGGRRP